MRRSTKSIRGETILATDGPLGHVIDTYFDDMAWVVRYLVVNTGTWLAGRKVLLSPRSLGRPGSFEVPANLTREDVRTSPDVDTDKPVSREHEENLHYHYGWPVYFEEKTFGGAQKATAANTATAAQNTVHHLRSMSDVTGHKILAHDVHVGHVEDFIVDVITWDVRYIAVDTADWRPAKKVLVSPKWVGDISWEHKTVQLDISEEQLRSSPEYNPAAPINREYEEQLYDYYGRRKYWH